MQALSPRSGSSINRGRVAKSVVASGCTTATSGSLPSSLPADASAVDALPTPLEFNAQPTAEHPEERKDIAHDQAAFQVDADCCMRDAPARIAIHVM